MGRLLKKSNICVAFEKYTNANNEEKTAWRTVGEILTFASERGNSTVIKLFQFPGTDFRVFPQKEQEQSAPQPARQSQPAVVDNTNLPVADTDEIPY